ncbi:MAG: hypothetical protein OEZ38_06880, partial [Gammaproteobacteria bacterium]|nr:hypothetical protein [Gammaproteobacteria bacterium]
MELLVAVIVSYVVRVLKNSLLTAFMNRFTHSVVAVVASSFVKNLSGLSLVNSAISRKDTALANSGVTFLYNDTPGTGASGFRHAFRYLLFILLMAVTSTVQAVQVDCSAAPYLGLIDGNDYPTPPANIKIDTNCEIRNFPASNPLNTNFSFDNAVPLFAIFDNVIHTGQMSCNTGAGHKMWFTNGSVTDIPASCQNFVIPAETIDKQPPFGQTSVGIGDPFTYRLTLPSMQFPAGAPSPNDLTNVVITDDLNATGADLSLVGTPVVTQGVVTLTEGIDYTFSNVGGLLTFTFPSIVNGNQYIISITAVLNDTPVNVPGLSFTNTARWFFDREIDVNEDGLIDPTETFRLPGEWGVATMVIGEPDLVVTKTSPETALNLGVSAEFTIDVQNVGGSDAWGITVLDQLPGGADDGMCIYDPSATVTLQYYAADGISQISGLITELSGLFSVNYTGEPTCQLSITTLSNLRLPPTQRLRIRYQSQLDASVVDGSVLTNVAGATEWFSANPAGAYPATSYTRTLTDAASIDTAIVDHEDSLDITAALSGYFFQKTVINVTTGENPARTAAPGDTLRYRLRFFNLNLAMDKIKIRDQLDLTRYYLPSFIPTTFPTGGGFILTDPRTNAGLLEIGGIFDTDLNIPANGEVLMEFEIDLLPTLTNGTVVSNQAVLSAEDPYYLGPAPIPLISIDSDDPNDLAGNGISPPGDPNPDPTVITIQIPGPLLKVNPVDTTVTIGEQFTYTITVPEVPIASPMYDVRISDDLTLSSADMRFVSASVVSGGTWSLVNTGTNTNVVIEDLATGIDIPANG